MNDYKSLITDFVRGRGGNMTELSRRLGLPRQAIYAWTARGSLRLSHLERIAAAYGYRVQVSFVPMEDAQGGPEGPGKA